MCRCEFLSIARIGGPEHALRYPSAYTHRVAISNSRQVSLSDGKVTFRWRDSAHGNKKRLMVLPVGPNPTSLPPGQSTIWFTKRNRASAELPDGLRSTRGRIPGRPLIHGPQTGNAPQPLCLHSIANWVAPGTTTIARCSAIGVAPRSSVDRLWKYSPWIRL